MMEKNQSIGTIQEITNLALILRSKMSMDKLTSLFQDMSILEYTLLTKIWPQLETDIDAECQPVYLQDIEAVSKYPMHQISKIVQHLHDTGCVSWERDDSKTYILPSTFGRKKLAYQKEILFHFFAQIILKLGEERSLEILSGINDFEKAIDDVIITTSDQI